MEYYLFVYKTCITFAEIYLSNQMKNKIYLTGAFLALFCCVSFANTASSPSYKIDNVTVDAIIDNAVEVNVSDAVASMLDINGFNRLHGKREGYKKQYNLLYLLRFFSNPCGIWCW